MKSRKKSRPINKFKSRSRFLSIRKKKRHHNDGGNPNPITPENFFNDLLDKESRFNKKQKLTVTTLEIFTQFFDQFKTVKFAPPKIQSEHYTKSEKELFNHINEDLRNEVESQMKITYKCSVVIGRPINITVSGDSSQTKNAEKYIHMIIFWLHIVTQYTGASTCNETLHIYLLLSDLKKQLPAKECTENDVENCIVKKTSVNTGFSTRCKHIVIYRKEEWFKVFIHETIHNYGLDFSFLRQHEEQNILNYFGIKTKFQVRLYEAYTESWARVLNSLLIAFDKEKEDLDKFIELANRNIQLERLNAYFQSCKILKYMNLNLDNLATYNEETSNLSYYFIVSMLYSDYQGYFGWCKKNNIGNFIQFNNNDPSHQKKFVDYIKKSYESKVFKDDFAFFNKTFFKNEDGAQNDYLMTYMRKSLLQR